MKARLLFLRCLVGLVLAGGYIFRPPDLWADTSQTQVRAGSNPVTMEALQRTWENMARELAALSVPENSNSRATNALSEAERALLVASVRSTSDFGQSVSEILQGSDNFIVQRVAHGMRARWDIGKSPIVMKFTAIDGRAVDLEKLRGQVVLIDFRGILHCAACVVDEPLLKEMYRKYHSAGFEIITISNDFPGGVIDNQIQTMESLKDGILGYLAKHELPWPTYFDGQGYMPFERESFDGRRASNPFFKQYDIYGTPTYFLIDKKGLLSEWPDPDRAFIFFKNPGYLENRIKQLLAGHR